MAHIISCMADADVDSLSLNSYIAKPVSPQPLDESVCPLLYYWIEPFCVVQKRLLIFIPG